jgi:hypothetical protein
MAVVAAFAALGACFALSGCTSSYCGAPCDPASARIRHESVVNQYGSVFGYLETEVMPLSQSQVEKTSLELLLTQDPKDSVILAALQGEEDSDFVFAYNDYSTGGSRFNAKGKLRLDAGVENPERRLPRLISESQNRELFERYRRVRMRIAWLAAHPAPPPRAADTLGNLPDTLWSGSFRAGGDSLAPVKGKFHLASECLAWGQVKAETFREKAFAFEFTCASGGSVLRRKVW